MLTNKIGRDQNHKISKVLEWKLVWTANKKSRVTAELVAYAANSGVTVSKRRVAWDLHRNGLHGHRPGKTQLLRKIHLKARLYYAKFNMEKRSSYWKRVIWSDETKLGHRSVAFVWRTKGEPPNPQNTIPTVKHGGGNVML